MYIGMISQNIGGPKIMEILLQHGISMRGMNRG